MDNQESETSVDLSSNNPGATIQNTNPMYGMLQQNQQMAFNNPAFYRSNQMNMPVTNAIQQTPQSMAQPNFNSYANLVPTNNMMPNQGMNNMMQPNMEWFQQAMVSYNKQQQQQQQQMMQPMNPGLNAMEFFAMANNMIANNNNFRNPMNQFMPPGFMNQSMNQSINPSMNPNMGAFPNANNMQNFMSNSRGFDSQKFEDSFNGSMNNSNNNFLKYMSNQNTGMNPTPMNGKKGVEFMNDNDTTLPNRTEFTQPFGSSSGFQTTIGSMNGEPVIPQKMGTMTLEDLNQRSNRKEEDPTGQNIRNEEQVDRGRFDWEDKPIKSSYISQKNEDGDFEEEDVRAASKTSFDYQSVREYKNPYDDVPIPNGGRNKRFEDLMEEQLKADPEVDNATRSKNKKPSTISFLRKGERKFLASAAAPSKTSGKDGHNQKENISSYNDIQSDNAVSDFHPQKSHSLKPNNNFGNQMGKTRSRDKLDSNFESGNEQRQTQRNKEAKKFLARGAGKGGGVGHTNTTPNVADAKQRKTHRDEDDLPERSQDRSKSANTKARPVSKKGPGDGQTDRSLRTEKSQDKLKGNARQEHYPDNAVDTRSLEMEYNMDKYTKKSPKGKRIEQKAKKSPKYMFEDGSDHEDGGERGDDEYDNRAETIEDGPAPISNLVDKYFYKTKPLKGKQPKVESQDEQNSEDERVQKFVNEKIEILNSEIAKFKLENERVKKIRQKHEEMLKNLNKDIADWNKQKEKEIKEFKDWKQEELKKINNEKKLAERQQKTLSNMPNRKEREEIDNLKKQISKLMEDIQHKEKRAKLDMERLKRQVKETEERNAELLQELRGYDQFRVREAANATRNSQANSRGRSTNNGYEDEEDQEDQEENEEDEENDNRQIIEERKEDEEEEDDSQRGRNEEGSDDENRDLKYDDIVVKNHKGPNSPKFVNEKKGNFVDKTNSMNTMNNRAGGPQGVQGKDSHLSTKGKGEVEKKGAPAEVKRQVTGKWSEKDYRFDANPYYMKHFVNKVEISKIVNQTVSPDGKIQRVYADGKKEVIFHNGVKREILPDGYTIVHFTNNDVKQTLPDSTIIYYFADAQTTQTTLPNGLHIYRFANNQLEFHNSDGSKDIHFADGTRKVIYINGEEETVFTDGTIQRVNAQKIKTIDYANKQRDIVYPDGLKIRTYPNGKTKKYYPDGSVEES